jgi:putative sterol carrier protein
MATLDEITERFRQAVGVESGLGVSVKFALKGEGVVRVHGGEVDNEDGPADLTMTLSRPDLEALGEGRLDPMAAVFSGKLKVSDMILAMKLQPKLQALFDRVR